MKIVALDAANSTMKVKSFKGENKYYNVIREFLDTSILGSKKSHKYFQLGSLDATAYTVGELDIMDSTTSSARDKDRYTSEQFKTECLFAIADHVENGDDVAVVIGLPASHYEDEQTRLDVAVNLVGTYTVYVSGEKRTFTVHKVLPILQPVGTLLDVAMNMDGTLVDEFLGKNIVIFDIGWGTTDLAHIYISKDGDITLRHTYYVPYAMSNVYTMLWDMLKKEYPNLKGKRFLPFKLDEELRGDNNVYEQAGVKCEKAGELRKECLKKVATQIMSTAKNMVELEQMDRVVFTGGGTMALLPYIKEHTEGVNAAKSKDTQMSNVRGFYLYGKMKLANMTVEEV
jgi:hypothetical protein